MNPCKRSYLIMETARELNVPVKLLKRLCQCQKYAVEHEDLCKKIHQDINLLHSTN